VETTPEFHYHDMRDHLAMRMERHAVMNRGLNIVTKKAWDKLRDKVALETGLNGSYMRPFFVTLGVSVGEGGVVGPSGRAKILQGASAETRMREARSRFMKSQLIQLLFPGRAAAASETAYLESEEAGGRAIPYPHVHVIGQSALSLSALTHICEVAWREALEGTAGSAAGMQVHAKEILSAAHAWSEEEGGPSECRQRFYNHKLVTLTPPGGRGPRPHLSGGPTRGIAALRSRGGGFHACLGLSQLPDADLDAAMAAYHDGDLAAGTQESTARSGPREWLAAASKLKAIMLDLQLKAQSTEASEPVAQASALVVAPVLVRREPRRPLQAPARAGLRRGSRLARSRARGSRIVVRCSRIANRRRDLRTPEARRAVRSTGSMARPSAVRPTRIAMRSSSSTPLSPSSSLMPVVLLRRCAA
jgi:hypothetical protein